MLLHGVFAIDVHELDNKIHPPGGRIGIFFSKYVLVAKHRYLIFDHEIALRVTIGYNSPSDDKPFMGFQFYFQSHKSFTFCKCFAYRQSVERADS